MAHFECIRWIVGRGDSVATPEEDEGCALGALVSVSARDHIVIAVAVDITGPGDADAQKSLLLARTQVRISVALGADETRTRNISKRNLLISGCWPDDCSGEPAPE